MGGLSRHGACDRERWLAFRDRTRLEITYQSEHHREAETDQEIDADPADDRIR